MEVKTCILSSTTASNPEFDIQMQWLFLDFLLSSTSKVCAVTKYAANQESFEPSFRFYTFLCLTNHKIHFERLKPSKISWKKSHVPSYIKLRVSRPKFPPVLIFLFLLVAII
jgi:hypothetical protein